MTISLKLKLARIESDLSAKEVGQKMNVCDQVIRRMESGDREPRASELTQLAEIYKKPITFFFSE